MRGPVEHPIPGRATGVPRRLSITALLRLAEKVVVIGAICAVLWAPLIVAGLQLWRWIA